MLSTRFANATELQKIHESHIATHNALDARRVISRLIIVFVSPFVF
jgi:hypothetical protein